MRRLRVGDQARTAARVFFFVGDAAVAWPRFDVAQPSGTVVRVVDVRTFGRGRYRLTRARVELEAAAEPRPWAWLDLDQLEPVDGGAA